jgi:hypothetical protein
MDETDEPLLPLRTFMDVDTALTSDEQTQTVTHSLTSYNAWIQIQQPLKWRNIEDVIDGILRIKLKSYGAYHHNRQNFLLRNFYAIFL